MRNGAFASQKIRQGLYEISDPINGKQSWTSGSQAIWYNFNNWQIGLLEDIGTDFCGLSAKDDYGGLDDDNNVWKYWSSSDDSWLWASGNDVSINCTSKNG